MTPLVAGTISPSYFDETIYGMRIFEYPLDGRIDYAVSAEELALRATSWKSVSDSTATSDPLLNASNIPISNLKRVAFVAFSPFIAILRLLNLEKVM